MKIISPSELLSPLGGLSVILPNSCRGCGHDVARIGPPVGPHLAGLRCTRCDRHRGWMSRTAHEFLTEVVNKFGRPTVPIAIRRGRDVPPRSGDWR
jgi:hypothetical protein